METLYKPIFTFSKEISDFRKEYAIGIFMHIRPYAVKELNPRYDEWNRNFEHSEIPEDDELKEYGGTKYCKYIQEKTREVLEKEINKCLIFNTWKFDCDEIGDIILRHKFDKDLTMTLELKPVCGRYSWKE